MIQTRFTHMQWQLTVMSMSFILYELFIHANQKAFETLPGLYYHPIDQLQVVTLKKHKKVNKQLQMLETAHSWDCNDGQF
jgi:hypothetical protein